MLFLAEELGEVGAVPARIRMPVSTMRAVVVVVFIGEAVRDEGREGSMRWVVDCLGLAMVIGLAVVVVVLLARR